MLLFILWFIVSSWSYNIDVENAQIYIDPKKEMKNERKSYFGFSVALYADPNDGGISLILVGAPRANVSEIKTVTEPGSVFKCPIQSNEPCKEWIMDPTEDGDIKFRNRHVSQLRDNAWTGANIAIKEGINPAVVVCAPRWKVRLEQKNRLAKYDWYLNGICYRTRVHDSLLFERPINGIFESKISPFYYHRQKLKIDGKEHYFYAMGQAGFSLHMVPKKEDLVLGSPGILDWTGTPFLVQVEERTPTREEMIYKNIKHFSVKYNNIHDTIDAIQKESSLHQNEYFGYSVSSGCYFRKEERWFSSGIPRGDNLNGRVLIFSHPNRTINTSFIIKNILNGEQRGEYFGSVLASCDLNNDEKDDLVVGAPLWSNEMEEGRIYVFSSKNSDDYLEAQYIHGEAIRGRFGSTITCIGDIDYDNYGDVAIGAPYENNHGAIYIYRGTVYGLQLSQKILGSEISSLIQGFGISISEARDIDNNGYSDIAVGAYLSDRVVLLRSKPVITLNISKMNPLANIKLQRNSNHFIIEACFQYTGKHVPDELNVTLHWKIDEYFGRANLPQEDNATIYEISRTLKNKEELCDHFQIDLNSKIQNFIDPIEISVSVGLETAQLNSTTNGIFSNFQFCKTCPVINEEHSIIEKSMTLPFAVDCGFDDICTSKLEIFMSSNLRNNRFVLGSRNTFSVFVNISNKGEPAYQSEIHIYIPEPLILANVPSECSENIIETNTSKGMIEVICSAGNPLKNMKTIKLEIATSGLKCDSNDAELEVSTWTQSENPNKDINYRMSIYFDVDLDMFLSGKAQEDSYSYSGEKESENFVKGIKFSHIYEIQRFGSCAVEEIIITLKIPIFLKKENNHFRIVEIIKMLGFIDNQEIQCFDSDKISLVEDDNLLVNARGIEKKTKITNEISENFGGGVNPLKYVPPENRTLNINCSNPKISCISFECKLSGLSNSTSTKMLLTMEIQSHVLKSTEVDGKDIIFYVTEGGMTVTKTEGFAHIIERKSFHLTPVGTIFLGSPIKQKVALSIWILSTLLGIILLTCSIFILTKLGFFARKQRKQLYALKPDPKGEIREKSEATLSTIALDQDC